MSWWADPRTIALLCLTTFCLITTLVLFFRVWIKFPLESALHTLIGVISSLVLAKLFGVRLEFNVEYKLLNLRVSNDSPSQLWYVSIVCLVFLTSYNIYEVARKNRSDSI